MIISWGIPTIKVKNLATGSTVITFHTPVEDSTQLSTEKGEKMEATIEGGEAEAVKYKRGKYTLEFQVRLGDSHNKWQIDGVDGVVTGEWEVELEPEDFSSGAPGFKIPKSVCSYEDSYSSDNGIIRTYQFESLKPETGKQILWTGSASVNASV